MADWYALRVRSNTEFLVGRALRSRGLDEFLPTYKTRRQWSDRVKSLEVPLFSGYLFCKMNWCERSTVIRTPGVLGMVSFGGVPTPIPNEEIEAVQNLVQTKLPLEPWPFLRIGQHVEVTWGPLAGLRGTILRFKANYRLVVSVNLLQRSVAAEVDSSWVEAAGGSMLTEAAGQPKTFPLVV
jgi:transcription antitermination factor NusG